MLPHFVKTARRNSCDLFFFPVAKKRENLPNARKSYFCQNPNKEKQTFTQTASQSWNENN
jgi:hypothetical protein